MGADPLSPIAPARVRVLVLPVGRIKRLRFNSFVERLQQASTVRLGDITPDGRPDRNMFSPLAFPNGTLFFDLSTALPTQSRLNLSPFELFREPLIVLGIADGLEYEQLGSAGQEDGSSSAGKDGPDEGRNSLLTITEQLRERFPKALVTQLLLMDHVGTEGSSWVPQDAICIAPRRHSTSTTIRTAMCDVSAKLLAEMASYATVVRGLPNIQSPINVQDKAQNLPSDQRKTLNRQSSITSQSSRAESPSPAMPFRPLSKLPPRDTSSPNLNSSRPISPPNKDGPPTSFDDIATAATSGGLTRSSSINDRREAVRSSIHERTSTQSPASAASAAERTRNMGKARVGITIGVMYLMAGRWSDAWRELVENTTKARSMGDHLWHAKGLENILVLMLLFSWAGFEFVVPTICYPASDRLSSIFSDAAKGIATNFGARDPSEANQSVAKFAKLLPDIVSTIQTMYNRAATFDEPLPQVAHSEMKLRLSRLLAITLNSGTDLSPAVLSSIVSSTPLSTHHSPARSMPVAGLSRQRIAEMLNEAYPETSPGHLPFDTTTLLSGIASIFSMLGYERKKGIVIKELIASLVPALVQARKVGAAEMGIHPAASLSLASSPFDAQNTENGETGIDGVLQHLRATYSAGGVPSRWKGKAGSFEINSDIEDMVDTAVTTAAEAARYDAFGSLNLKVDILRATIDFCEALPDLSGIINASALLLRCAGPCATVSPDDPKRLVSLSTEEQVRLISNMSRASNAAAKAGISVMEAPYWDDFLVRNVQVVDVGDTALLIEHAGSDLETPKANAKTPFLYNPFAKKPDNEKKESIIVASEETKIVITLQNPYDTEIEIEHIDLVVTGGQLKVQQTRMILGPARLQNVTIVAVATLAGVYKIEGCYVKVSGCAQRLFPVFQDPWTADPPMRLKSHNVQMIVDKPGAPTEQNGKTLMAPRLPLMSLPAPYVLSLTVTEAQPHVIVDSISLNESALMILEGEKSSFKVTLRNLSNTISANFLHISFEDSLTASIRSSITTKEVTKADLHELESQLLRNPILKCSRIGAEDASVIQPHDTATFEISVVGRPGLSTARIMFDFAHLEDPSPESQKRFFTRQVAVPISITVNASVQLHRADLSPFPSDFAWANQSRQQRVEGQKQATTSRRSASRIVEKGNGRFRTLLDRVGLNFEDGEHCLFLLDLRNAWPNPLSVSIDVRESLGSEDDGGEGEETWKRAYTVHEVIHPGHIARVVLILPKIYLRDPYAPIPALSRQSERQFVVSNVATSPDQERLTRKTFWYREELLKHLRGSWKEETSERCGEVDLRALRLSGRMLEVIGVEDMDIGMSVSHSDKAADTAPTTNATADIKDSNDEIPVDHIRHIGPSRYQIPTERFLTLKTTLRNRSRDPVRALLRLQPRLANQTNLDTALDFGRKILWSGLLQHPVPIIPANGTVEVELGFVVLCSGDFEIGATVEEIRVPADSDLGSGNGNGKVKEGGNEDAVEDLDTFGKSLARTERRTWHSKEVLGLFVTDGGGGGGL